MIYNFVYPLPHLLLKFYFISQAQIKTTTLKQSALHYDKSQL